MYVKKKRRKKKRGEKETWKVMERIDGLSLMESKWREMGSDVWEPKESNSS